MSLAESPVYSSSSDDFAGLLERELESGSSESSPVEEDKEAGDDGSDVESETRCVIFLSFMFTAEWVSISFMFNLLLDITISASQSSI